jgi:hypothetical protein
MTHGESDRENIIEGKKHGDLAATYSVFELSFF